MAPFTPLDPAKLPGPASLLEVRERALARFELGPLPSLDEEIWRHSRVGQLDLGRFEVARPQAPDALPASVREIRDSVGARAAFALTVDGAVASIDVERSAAAHGVRLHTVKDGDPVASITGATTPWDAFVELNTGQAPSPLVVSVRAGAVVDAPIVVCHWTRSGDAITFPRVLVDLGVNASATVLECFLSDDVVAWVDPVTELRVADGGHLRHVVVQELGSRVWQTAYIGAQVERDAELVSFAVALGGDYARVRTDCTVVGAGGNAQLLALYCGDGTQMHDFITIQNHEGRKSTSDLVFKGTVQDEARSSYWGLIRIARGAAGTQAFQTNRNLVLSESAGADSVPNLDIQENDVSCSHASATGPIDEDQRFYLESRGVSPEVADRLIVLGFFQDLLQRLPVAALRPHLAEVIGRKLGVTGA